MKLVLSGGGTGGHVNPALAIASAMEDYGEKKGEPVEVFYVGTSKGIENKLVPKKYPMYHVEIQGLRRSLSPANLKTLYLTVRYSARRKSCCAACAPILWSVREGTSAIRWHGRQRRWGSPAPCMNPTPFPALPCGCWRKRRT